MNGSRKTDKTSHRPLVMSALAILTIVGVGTAAHPEHDMCEGFVPENTMKIPVGTKKTSRFYSARNQTGGLTEAEFNAVIDRAERLYAPIVQKAGGVLKVNRLWTNETVNASAQQFGTSWVVNMYGGLARHAAITTEGMALVICHEIGHHLGGAPKIDSMFGSQWATNEGGADYFATLKCLRNFFAEDDNLEILKTKQVDSFAAARCTEQFTDEKDQAICMRTSLSGQSVAFLFQDLRKESVPPKFDTPDTTVLDKMYDGHPGTQCRLDTYFAGMSCPVRVDVAQSDTDYKQGACVAGVDKYGARPSCWFVPSDAAAAPAPVENQVTTVY